MTAAATALTPTSVKNVAIGPTIDKLNDLRESKRKLEAQMKVIEAEYAVLEEALMAKFEREGTNKGAGKNASASVTSIVVGNVTDWDAFNAYVKKSGFFNLYQKRLSDTSFRELLELGKKVPGVEPFTKARLNLRTGV